MAVTCGTTFLRWVASNGFKVVVWDMDRTMSSGHCGAGLLIDKLQSYIDGASLDFIEAANALSTSDRSIKFAIATGSDPDEYNIEGQSKETHILGPDLAFTLIGHHSPQALKLFEIAVGYDCRLHPEDNNDSVVNNEGKRHHMRKIRDHFGVNFQEMVLIDDSDSSLVNEDGWKGVKVDGTAGFKFEHCGNLR
jgi:hypothetical protein